MALNQNWHYLVTGNASDLAKIPHYIPTGLDIAYPRHDFVLTATIASAAAVSDEIDLGGATMLSLVWPSAWTAADLTFLVSDVSGGTFTALYDDGGTEVKIASASLPTAEARTITNASILTKVGQARFIKLRSGVAATPVNQGAERSIKIICKG